jgi:phospholipase/carboxylesterase
MPDVERIIGRRMRPGPLVALVCAIVWLSGTQQVASQPKPPPPVLPEEKTQVESSPQDSEAKPPAHPPGEFTAGAHPLKLDYSRDGVLYLPRGYKAGLIRPLIVWLHGAGGSSAGFDGSATARLADELGFIVLAPDSREWTWDLVLGTYGPDVDFVRQALAFTLAHAAVDKNRIGLAGFSDGASYALSLGISNSDVFQWIMAFSPGVMRPVAAPGRPRFFISHGRSDPTMPIDVTSRRFVPRLKGLGYDVTYREFDGRHTLPPEILREAFEWFMR